MAVDRVGAGAVMAELLFLLELGNVARRVPARVDELLVLGEDLGADDIHE